MRKDTGPKPAPGADGNKHLPVSTLLPVEVRQALMRAAATPGTDRDKRIAIAKATDLARRTKPKLFKEL